MPNSSTGPDLGPVACGTGFSRRNFMRLAAATSAIASVPIFTESRLAYAQRPHFADPNKGIHIDANENPLGPSESARAAIAAIIPKGGRYEFNMQMDLAETFAKIEGLDPESVMPYAGSSEPLHYTVLAFTSPSKPLVTADPGYEAPMWAAKAAGAEVIKVPLLDPKGAASHDVKTMVSKAAMPGVIYICNPNNPTGTVTPQADIDYVVTHAPKGTIVLIDEAYIHLSNAPSSLHYVKEGKDVIVLRTFSKLYGMAGIRMGFAVGRPELLSKLTPLGGQNSLPITAIAAAKASLLDTDLVASRKKLIGDIRAENLAWLKSEGYAVTPSDSNCFMLDVKRPGKEVLTAMAAKDVYIGRIWPAWPTQVRITVGTREEMAVFQKTFKEVMSSSTAGLEPLALPKRMRETPFSYLS
jgi:histidinol-phosphate aminotransferase